MTTTAPGSAVVASGWRTPVALVSILLTNWAVVFRSVVHLPERLSRLGERGRGAVGGIAGDFPEEDAGHSGKVTGGIGGIDGRDRDSERPEDLKDGDFAPQVRAVGQFQERGGALAPDAEDLVVGEGRHLSGVRDGRAGEPGCEAAGFGRGQSPGDEGSSAERDSWFGNALTACPAWLRADGSVIFGFRWRL